MVRSDWHIRTRQGLQLNQLELAFFLQHWMGLPIKLNRRTELPLSKVIKRDIRQEVQWQIFDPKDQK